MASLFTARNRARPWGGDGGATAGTGSATTFVTLDPAVDVYTLNTSDDATATGYPFPLYIVPSGTATATGGRADPQEGQQMILTCTATGEFGVILGGGTATGVLTVKTTGSPFPFIRTMYLNGIWRENESVGATLATTT